MDNVEAKRTSRTRRDIKRALITLLGSKTRDDISMSELAREAQISRSTLYQHYNNVYEVYVDAVRSFDEETAPIMSHAACFDGAAADDKPPFCSLLRSENYRNITKTPCFLSTYWETFTTIGNSAFLKTLTDAGYSPEIAMAIAVFQTGGCFNAVQRYGANDATWHEVREAIDTFICGGLSACQEKKRHQLKGRMK